jgi:hypothetical protein
VKEGARLSDSGTRNVFSVHESVLFSYITVMLGAHSYPRGSAPWTPATAWCLSLPPAVCFFHCVVPSLPPAVGLFHTGSFF